MSRSTRARGNTAPSELDATVKLVLDFVKTNQRHHGKFYPTIGWVNFINSSNGNQAISERDFNKAFKTFSIDTLTGHAECAFITDYESTHTKVQSSAQIMRAIGTCVGGDLSDYTRYTVLWGSTVWEYKTCPK